MTGSPFPSSAEKVLAAALKLFDEVGYSAATIEDIRLQSEVSVGSIYHHFGSKEGIAGALYVTSLRDFQGGLLRALRVAAGKGERGEGRQGERAGEGGGEAEAGVRAGVGHHLRWIDGDRPRARFLMRRRETEVARINQADVDALNRALHAELEDWYRPHVEAGAIRDLPLPLLYAVWLGPAQEYARLALERSDPPPLTAAEPVLADAAWAALRPERLRSSR